MEDDFCPPMPYTLGYSATSKSTDSLFISFVALKALHMGLEPLSVAQDARDTPLDQKAFVKKVSRVTFYVPVWLSEV